jgi:membrane protein implicated in regulation of membrane protease activity
VERWILAGLFEIAAVIASLVATFMLFGVAAALYLFAAWALIFAFVLTPRPKRRSTQ